MGIFFLRTTWIFVYSIRKIYIVCWLLPFRNVLLHLVCACFQCVSHYGKECHLFDTYLMINMSGYLQWTRFDWSKKSKTWHQCLVLKALIVDVSLARHTLAAHLYAVSKFICLCVYLSGSQSQLTTFLAPLCLSKVGICLDGEMLIFVDHPFNLQNLHRAPCWQGIWVMETFQVHVCMFATKTLLDESYDKCTSFQSEMS